MNAEMKTLVLLSVVFACGPIVAQSSTHAVGQGGIQAYGAVTGHVSCVDTNLPARLAKVTLVPVVESASTPKAQTLKANQPEEFKPMPLNLSVNSTHLDGSYAIARVRPGRYYVIVQQPGYLSPVAEFSQDQIDHPTDADKAEIAKLVPEVAVGAGETSNVDVRLLRAASIEGTIRYDDGTPSPEYRVSIERKNSEGKWVQNDGVSGAQTDDAGHFRATGLAAGEFRLATSLHVDVTKVDSLFGGSHSMMSNFKSALSFYFGDTFIRKDAKTIKLGDGQSASGIDFTIPVSKLHTISGSLVDARSGRVLNAETVALFTPDGEQQIESVSLAADDTTFRLEFVPEGTYTVKVGDAREVVRELEPSKDGYQYAEPRYKETTVKSYGKYEAPFKVESEMTGVTLPIPSAGAR